MLVAEVVEWLGIARAGVIVDGTVGLGGHAAALLDAVPDLHLVGFDVDPDALDHARERLARWHERVELVHASYTELAPHLGALGHHNVDGVLLDLGVSSLQLDTPERGFSFRHEAPLDMRFSQSGETAAEILATITEEELMRVLSEYGEEPRARRIARAIVRVREHAPIRTTGDLHRVVRAALGRGRGRIDPATRTFQALRIATNRELEGLATTIEDVSTLLRPLGRLAVIAFHSVEDRIVKRSFRRLSGRCICPPGTAVCTCGPRRVFDVLTRKPVQPQAEELEANPRSRSARLRVAERRTP